MEVNQRQKTILIDRIKSYYNGELKGKKFGLWGLAFKPNTDDIREAPALYLIDALIESGAEIIAYDPEAMENVKSLIGDKINYATGMYDATTGVDALIIATEWSVFRTPNFDTLAEKMNEKVIFDGRNLYKVEEMKELDFYYESIGRSSSKSFKKVLNG